MGQGVTYTFGSHFTYKRWVRVFYQNLNFNFLGQVFQYFCWVSKCVYWGSHGLAHLLVTLVKVQLMSLLPQASKVSFWFNAKLSKCVRHTEEKRRKRKERPFGHECDWVRNTLEWRAEAERAIRPLWEKHKWELQEVQSKEIEKKTIRVWKGEKEKWDIFLCSSYTQGR